jgi:uncharacterized membrane protein YcaP (DUF421 family)
VDSVIRALLVYIFLLLIFRIAGKRSLAHITTFDFVLLLIISEASQNALVGESYSITHAFLLIITLVGIDIALSVCKQKSPRLEKWLEGIPLVIVENGNPLRDRMDKSRVDVSEILAAARIHQGLERMNQIKHAVLERSGGISIIPQDPSKP